MTAIDISGDGGVLKEILVEGEGEESPQHEDEVYVHYVGTLEDGSKFDSSRDRNTPFNFTLGTGRVIKGWDTGVATMKKGEKCILTIRSDYGYGDAGSPPKIPANATLKFEVELLRWNEKDVTGTNGAVTFRVQDKGTGKTWEHPGAIDEVVVTYTATCEGKELKKAEADAVALGHKLLPKGVEMALTKEFCKGMRAVVTCGAEFCGGFGPEGKALTYDITLVDWNSVRNVFGDGGVMVTCFGQVDSYDKCEEGAEATIEITGKLAASGEVFDAKRTVTAVIGDGTLDMNLEGALKEVKVGQSAKVTIRKSHLIQITLPQEDLVFDVTVIAAKRSHSLSTEEKLEVANKRREQGNGFFKTAKLDLARRKYDAAMSIVEHIYASEDAEKEQVDKAKLLIHLNLSMVHRKLGAHKDVLAACNAALQLDGSNTKALFRRGCAHCALNDLESARADLTRAGELDPSIAKEVQAQMNQVAKKQKLMDKKDQLLFSAMMSGLTSVEPTDPVKASEGNEKTEEQSVEQSVAEEAAQ